MELHRRLETLLAALIERSQYFFLTRTHSGVTLPSKGRIPEQPGRNVEPERKERIRDCHAAFGDFGHLQRDRRPFPSPLPRVVAHKDVGHGGIKPGTLR
jgi:hypothetical protein